jgi:fatty acid desaturase
VELNFKIRDLFLIVLAIPFGWIVASFLHNTGHGNIKNNYLNKLIGEFCGNFVGYGFNNFILVHTLHHQYSDHQFDPVNPKGMTFLKFVLAPIKYMIVHTKQYLRFKHGHHKNYEKILFSQSIVFYINLILRQIIWLYVFGSKLYLLFYLPALFSNILILAHINYVCHRDFDDGSVEIFNLDHNLYYKVANFITMGGYYHKSHHLSLNYFDPRNYKGKRLFKPLRTVQGNQITLNNLNKIEKNNNSLRNYFNLNNIWVASNKF